MDIAATSMSMSQNNVMTQVNVSMAKKAMDQAKLQGNQLAQMVESTNVVSATKLDARV